MLSALMNNYSMPHLAMGAGALLILAGIAVLVYYLRFSGSSSSSSSSTYHPNSEGGDSSNSNSSGAPQSADLLFFFADWCPHCKVAKPVIAELQAEYETKTINGYTMVFTPIDCSEETEEISRLMTKYDVKGYPTIKLIKDGQVIDFEASPTKEALEQFLHTML